MSHTIRDKAKLIARVRRLKGQVEAIERGLVADAPCGDVLQLVASVRGAVGGLTAELMEDHLREHVLGGETAEERALGAEELVDVIRTYLR